MIIKQGKTNWKYILIVVVLALLVGGGILWWIGEQDFSIEFSEVKKPEKIEDETANWTTYRNEEFGFAMKYPHYLDFKIRSKTIELGNILAITWYPNLKGISGSEKYLSLEEWLSKMASIYRGEVNPVVFGKDNYGGFLFSYPTKPPPQSFFPGIFVQKGNAIFQIIGEIRGSIVLEKDNETKRLVNQMLSTFRFLD